MFYLSGQYAAAKTDAQRSLFMAAGQALFSVSIEHGTGPYMGLLLIAVAGLMASVVMLRNKTFGKVTAYAGILANVFQLAEPPVRTGTGAFLPERRSLPHTHQFCLLCDLVRPDCPNALPVGPSRRRGDSPIAVICRRVTQRSWPLWLR